MLPINRKVHGRLVIFCENVIKQNAGYYDHRVMECRQTMLLLGILTQSFSCVNSNQHFHNKKKTEAVYNTGIPSNCVCIKCKNMKIFPISLYHVLCSVYDKVKNNETKISTDTVRGAFVIKTDKMTA